MLNYDLSYQHDTESAPETKLSLRLILISGFTMA